MAEVRLVIQISLGLVFAISTVAKLLDPLAFVEGVKRYGIASHLLSSIIGMLIIAVEGWLAITHLSGRTLTLGAPIALCLLGSFAVAVGINLVRGRQVPCHCFGRYGEILSFRTLARLALLGLGEVLLVFQYGLPGRHYPVPDPRATSFQQIGLALFWALLVLLIGSWSLSLGDLWGLFRPCRNCGAQNLGMADH
jgi:Methylamine utilisation protein MauE